MKIAVLYVGSSLPRPLKEAEGHIRRSNKLEVSIAAHNCGDDIPEDFWPVVSEDIVSSEVLFIIHVTNEENAARIRAALAESRDCPKAVIAINCMPGLMRCTRMGKLDFGSLAKSGSKATREPDFPAGPRAAVKSEQSLARKLGGWMADSIRSRRVKSGASPRPKPSGFAQYTRLITRLPAILKYLPTAGKFTDAKHYLNIFCYFLQPTPANIRWMLLYVIKHYVPGNAGLRVPRPESMPSKGIYHPDAGQIFTTFVSYSRWWARTRRRPLDPKRSVGLLLMRPQIISGGRRHYDSLIRAIEDEGLCSVPVLSTFMDNREACNEFLVEPAGGKTRPRVSQLLSLTGFSFVGGPAMNDSEAAVDFLKELNVPLRSALSLDIQTIENWESSRIGLNPVQTAMQVAIPEIDGATEPFAYGGMPESGFEPEPIEDRCRRIAKRLARWNRLQTAARSDLKLAFTVFCFPPNKGNAGTAAELDVIPSVFEILKRLSAEGYKVELPGSADELRRQLLGSELTEGGIPAAIADRISVDQYRRLCPYTREIEQEWGPAPGALNSDGRSLLIPGILLGNVLITVQPTFGYEGDPMRLLAAESGAPHHGFMALYTYIEKVFKADAVVHVGTHGALEFMPGKQAALSSRCWPDRLIGELPNIYIYSVNNPSEGSIAKRRSYAELISYLTPPVTNAGLYKGLASLKELIQAYRESRNSTERDRLFAAIEEQAGVLNLGPSTVSRASTGQS